MGEVSYKHLLILMALTGVLLFVHAAPVTAACGGVKICGQDFACGANDGLCPEDYGADCSTCSTPDPDCAPPPTACLPGDICCDSDGTFSNYDSPCNGGGATCDGGTYYAYQICDGAGHCIGDTVVNPDTSSTACSCGGDTWVASASRCCGDDGFSDYFSVTSGSTCYACSYGSYSATTCASPGCATDGLVSGESCLINEACSSSGYSLTNVNCDSYDDTSGWTWAESEVTSSSCTSSCTGSGCCDVQSVTCYSSNECKQFYSLVTNEEDVPNAKCYRANAAYWAWSTSPPAETNCNDGYDNDCDGSCDYDSSSCGAADSSCTVSVTGITIPSQVCPAETFQVDCSVSAPGINSVVASIDGKSCSYIGGSWSGNTASFTCTTPSSNGDYTVRCSLDPTKSYQSGPDKTATLTVGGSGCCSQYTPTGQGSCEADPNCDWCTECSGTKYSGGADRCVSAGSCTYSCDTSASCGAACDTNTAFTAEACTDSCSGNTLTDYTPNVVSDACDLSTCTVTDNTCASGTTVNTIDCGVTQCSTYYAGLHVASGSCTNGCSGASCDSCIPDLTTDCTCEAGWTNADGNPSNGCELACAPTNGGVEICDGLDNDCNGLVDDGLSPRASNNYKGVCAGSTQICSGGAWVYDYTLNPLYESTESTCDGLDNDCDGLVDEGTSGSCYDQPMCAGSLDCSAYYASSGVCASGCTLQGHCSDTYAYCGQDSDCASNQCINKECSGTVSCAGFSTTNCQTKYTGFGCSVSGAASYADKANCETNGYTWSCSAPTYEICSDNVDNTGAGMDCLDATCMLGSYAGSQVDRYNCLGTNQDGSTVSSAYCAVAPNDPSVGLCCPAGTVLSYTSGSDTYTCVAASSCSTPTGSCAYDYTTAFSTWLMSNPACVSASSACCDVTVYGTTGQYALADNVKAW